MGHENTFEPGERVRIVCENSEAELPYGFDAGLLDNHRFKIGTEVTLPTDVEDEYDGWDNSWLIRHGGRKMWVHEGAMALAVKPVTPEEEDEALASIMKALGS